MTQHVQQPRLFSKVELDARKEKSLYLYINGTMQHRQLVIASSEAFTFYNLEDLVDHSQRMALDGRPRCPHTLLFQSIGFYNAAFRKTQEEQDKDLATIYQQVEQDYRDEIEAFNQSQVELLTQQMFEAEKKKKIKKQQEEESRMLASAAREAQEYFQSIISKGEEQ